jgi:ParB-like chromosome segregation protein Spo0J
VEHKIKMISVDSLIPYAMNARTHSDGQITQIASSIKEFGFTSPILTDGDNGIIAGHGRLMAAKKLELEKVPCIELKHLSPTQKRALILADNKIALNSGWDEEMLKLELEALGDDVEMTGFSVDELNLIMKGWQSDIEIPPEVDEDDTQAKIVIKIDKEALQFAKETITNALDSAGIDYEW